MKMANGGEEEGRGVWYRYFSVREETEQGSRPRIPLVGLQETSAHGLDQIRPEQGWFLKIFWGLCWLICVVSFVFSAPASQWPEQLLEWSGVGVGAVVGRIVVKFNKEEVGTGIELTKEDEVIWPELRLCYPNPIFYQPALDMFNVSRRRGPSLASSQSQRTDGVGLPLQSSSSSSCALGILTTYVGPLPSPLSHPVTCKADMLQGVFPNTDGFWITPECYHDFADASKFSRWGKE